MSLTQALRLIVVLILTSTALAQNSKTPPHKSLPKDYSFTVEANQVWTDTGLDLDRSDRIHVTGAVIACEGPSPSEKAHLLAKLHGEAPPILASPDADVPIIAPSHLYLGVNAVTL